MKKTLFILLLCAVSLIGKAQTVTPTFTDIDSMYVNDSEFTMIIDSSGMYVNVPATPIPAPQGIGDTTKARSVYLVEVCDMLGYCLPYYKVNNQSISFSVNNGDEINKTNAYTSWQNHKYKFLFWYLTYIYYKTYGIQVEIK